ncbi:UNVERIFIED_CONTAM: hypothetical protein Sindi_3129100 [Sesamum indicum]
MGIVLQGGQRGSSAAMAWPTTRALGALGPYCVGKRTAGVRVASSPDSDLEAFSHNPAHGSFAHWLSTKRDDQLCGIQRYPLRTSVDYYCPDCHPSSIPLQ